MVRPRNDSELGVCDKFRHEAQSTESARENSLGFVLGKL